MTFVIYTTCLTRRRPAPVPTPVTTAPASLVYAPLHGSVEHIETAFLLLLTAVEKTHSGMWNPDLPSLGWQLWQSDGTPRLLAQASKADPTLLCEAALCGLLGGESATRELHDWWCTTHYAVSHRPPMRATTLRLSIPGDHAGTDPGSENTA